MWRNKVFWSLSLLGLLILTLLVTGSLKVGGLSLRLEFSKVQRMDPDTLFRKLQAGEPLVIVDVRSPADFEKEHIKGSLPMPFDQLEMRYSSLPAGKAIILY